VETNGYVAIDAKWQSTFQSILERCSSLVGIYGALYVACWYVDRLSKKDRRFYDNVGLSVRSGKCYLDYWPSGSKSRSDPTYRTVIVQDLIRLFGLPLALTDDADGCFRLKHRTGGELSFCQTDGENDGNPVNFSCEIARTDYANLLKEMSDYLDLYASHRLNYRWRLIPLKTDQVTILESSKIVYQALRAAPFPAKEFEVHFRFHLSSLDGITGLAAIATREQPIYIDLCKFTSADKTRYKLGFNITSSGSTLLVLCNKNMTSKEFRASPVGKKLATYL
jgi:hypothetical protein